jgi:hypothetical protein
VVCAFLCPLQVHLVHKKWFTKKQGEFEGLFS